MKTLKSFNFANKTLLLRVDINSDIANGKVIMSERIKESAKSIKDLIARKAKIIILAHQGSPGKDDFIGLKQHCKLLNKFVKVRFVPDILGERAVIKIKKLKPGEAILLDNIRFIDDEFHPEKKDNIIISKLVPLADFYVNDAFSVCHREQTSVILAKYLKSCAGRILEREVNALKKIKIKNCLYILGGAKPEDNIKLLKGNKVLACGLFGQLCLIANGKDLGAQNEYLKKELILNGEIITKLKDKLSNIEMPEDFAVKVEGKRKELKLEDFPSKYEIFDIGQKTQDKYAKEIKKASSVYMKGPAGFCAEKRFAKGTFAILKAIAESKAFSVIGGGHLSDAIEKSGINKNKFGYISLSGGALLNYVAGEKLPGLEALGIK